MSDRAADPRSNRVFNAALVVLGAALGIAAVCLIVFGTSSPRQLLVGIIVGLWAALLAAFGLQGLRRPAADAGVAVEDLDALQDSLSVLAASNLKATENGLKTTQETITTQGQDFRRMSELQSARDTAARREADLSLQLAIRHEIERTVADQVGSLREEVSSLRAEVVDRLDGQIKLERIEITRVIGSDLEALQNEVRRLATQREAAFGDRGAAQDSAVQPAAADLATSAPAARADLAEIVDAEIVDVHSSAEPAPAVDAGSFSQSWGPVRAVRAKAPAPASFESSSPEPFAPEPPAPRPLQPEPFLPQPFEPKPFEPEPLPSRPQPPLEPPRPDPAPEPEPLPPLEPPPPAGRNGASYPAGADIFADLPRLTPISPDLLGLSGKRRAPEDDPSSPNSRGRRRAPGHASD